MMMHGLNRVVLAAVACAVGSFAHAEVIDAVAAIVDREVILRSELMAEARPAINELRSTATSQAEFEREAQRILRETLEQQIENKLLLRQAEFLGAQVTDEQIDQDIAATRRDLGLSYEEFLDEIAKEGLTMSDLRERRRKLLTARRMAVSKRRQLEREVVVSEDEVQEYYEAHRSEYERPEEVLVSQIQLQPGPDPAARERARARLEMIRRELEAGADFSELARAHSQDMFAEDGGSMGWIQRGVLQVVLEEAVFSLEPGAASDIIETPAGLHLMRLDDRREAGQRTLDEVRGEIEPILRARAAEERYQRWLADLRKRSRVRVFL